MSSVRRSNSNLLVFRVIGSLSCWFRQSFHTSNILWMSWGIIHVVLWTYRSDFSEKLIKNFRSVSLKTNIFNIRLYDRKMVWRSTFGMMMMMMILFVKYHNHRERHRTDVSSFKFFCFITSKLHRHCLSRYGREISNFCITSLFIQSYEPVNDA